MRFEIEESSRGRLDVAVERVGPMPDYLVGVPLVGELLALLHAEELAQVPREGYVRRSEAVVIHVILEVVAHFARGLVSPVDVAIERLRHYVGEVVRDLGPEGARIGDLLVLDVVERLVDVLDGEELAAREYLEEDYPQAEGVAPIVRGYPVKEPQTIATAIRIGNPASWQKAVAARDESGGTIDMVSDDEIMAAYRLMAAKGGIFGEPASAASLAGLIKLSGRGMDFSQKRVVCVVTGSGLKDPDNALESAEPFLELPADLAAVEQALGWG